MTGKRRDWDDPESMLSVDDVLGRILDAVSPLPAVGVNLLEAQGLVVASDLKATENIPPFRNSAMDGYAVRSDDTVDAPVCLRVIGTRPAGSYPEQHVSVGEAVRIMTGAVLPEGADSVVRFEETDESLRPQNSHEISISRFVEPGKNVREAGEAIRAGTTAISAGARLGPSEIGVLAMLNQQTVSVHRRPRVGILSTGDEVRALGVDLPPGTIRDSNAYMLAAQVRRLGAEVSMLGIATDSTDDLVARLHAASGLDMLVTSGGVSVGDYDMVKHALQAAGTMDIWQVRMKPGKPLAFGDIGGVPLLGLPGNPFAAMVSFEQFGRPAVLKMLGRHDVTIPIEEAVLEEPVVNRGGRRHFVRGTLRRATGTTWFSPARFHGSGVLRSSSPTDCLLIVPEDVQVLEAGQVGRVQRLNEGL